MQHYFEPSGSSQILQNLTKDLQTSSKPGSQQTSTQSAEIHPELLRASKRASRKVLLQCHNNLPEILGKLDYLDEGIVLTEDLKRSLDQARVSGLEKEELNALLKVSDLGNKGYLSTNKFIEKLYQMAAETDAETILRRISKIEQDLKINLRTELQRCDATGKGVLDKVIFKRSLKQVSIALTDAEIQRLLNDFGICSPGARGITKDAISIKTFVDLVAEVSKTKPLPNYISGAKRGRAGMTGLGGQNAMELYEAEKKYKRNLEVLKSEIQERNREIEDLKKDVKDSNDRYTRLQDQQRKLE
jgi:Ca2+-binding EF-hand superfamily protein